MAGTASSPTGARCSSAQERQVAAAEQTTAPASLGVVLLSTALMLCDGILSPAAPVVAAMAGVQGINPVLSNVAIAGIRCANLLARSSTQRFGASRLGLPVSIVLLQ
ncbi:probable potassium transporter 9 [Coccomyxa sp. Obi]|nr:probable potassium transporter 9 [Coccomyxa sp. Obi]